MNNERRELSKNAEKLVKIVRSSAEKGFTGDVNICLSKDYLGKMQISEIDKLRLLAMAYEKQAELRYIRPTVDNSHLIPTAELENIGDRAIAAELKQRILKIEQDSAGKV